MLTDEKGYVQDTGKREIITRNISERQDGLEIHTHDEELACPLAHDFSRQVAEPTSIYSVRKEAR